MIEIDQALLETCATEYDGRLVPALFTPWARVVVGMAEIASGHRVLDIACGTGVLARQAAEQGGAGAVVHGLDSNPGMLAVARRRSPGIRWHEGEAGALPFGDGIFDRVVSQFGLMFFPDKVEALVEMRRVLAPGGRLILAVFDGLSGNPAFEIMVSVFARHVGEDAGDMLRFPFTMGDPDGLKALLQEAGCACDIQSRTEIVRFASVGDLVLADVKGWFPLAGLMLDEPTVEAIIADAAASLGGYVAADGAVAFPVRAHLATAIRA